MNKKVIIINGPNLNLLGTREKEVYGNMSFKEFYEGLKEAYLDLDLDFFQSNIEGEIVDKLQETGFSVNGIVLNAGGYTHTSVAIRDAIAAVESPVIEVHVSNPHAREDFRHKSLISGVCKGIIAGFGLESYALALDSFL